MIGHDFPAVFKKTKLCYNTSRLLHTRDIPPVVRKLTGGAVIRLPIIDTELDVRDSVEVANILSDDNLVEYLETYLDLIRQFSTVEQTPLIGAFDEIMLINHPTFGKLQDEQRSKFLLQIN